MIYWIIAKGVRKMNNKFLLIIVALIVVFGAFIFLGDKKTDQTNTIAPSKISENKNIATVTLTDSGFTPKDLIVKAGTTVVWLNKSGVAATVNSNDHPTHQLYPFLNLGEFGDSSSVQLSFDKPGTYTYHNHYNATSTGTVVVK